MRHAQSHEQEKDHGQHTLEVLPGVVVGVNGHDVFVDLGPRRQGVIQADAFDGPATIGSRYDFVLHGREESLWVLSLAGSRSMSSWVDAEPGNLVSARVLRMHEDGLQLKIGRLHAWMPKGQAGVPKGHNPSELIGRTVRVEVLEVDPRHQRVIVSRKAALRRERTGFSLPSPGDRVQGRVVRLEEYGAFIQLGTGRQGLLHISNVSHEPVEDIEDVLRLGESIQAVVLHVREGGRRIALGLKQLRENPFTRLAKTAFEGQIIEGMVTRILPHGALVRVEPGVIGLLPKSQTASQKPLRTLLRRDQRLCVRILRLDTEQEQLTLSLQHVNGAAIAPDEASLRQDLSKLAKELGATHASTNLGRLLRNALHRDAS